MYAVNQVVTVGFVVKMEISPLQALETLEYMKILKQQQRIIDEEFMNQIYIWLCQFRFDNYHPDAKTFCMSCKNGSCFECINDILNIEICNCKGAKHLE